MSYCKQLFILFLSVTLFSLILSNVLDIDENLRKELSLCYCGPNGIKCTVNPDGHVVCECYKGYAQKYDNCDECVCDNGYTSCSFDKETKVCSCYDNIHTNCTVCDCGLQGIGCKVANGKKECLCNRGYGQNDATGKCEPCSCGALTKKCKIENGQFKCSCKGDTAQKGNSCEECKCNSTRFICSFKGDQKQCNCDDGYIYSNGDCIKICDCGSNSIDCKLENGKKNCSCKPGFAQDRDDLCKSCDCGEYGEECKFENGKKKCTCKMHYAQDSIEYICKEEIHTGGESSGASGSVVAFSVIGSILIVIALGALILVYVKRRRSYERR